MGVGPFRIRTIICEVGAMSSLSRLLAVDPSLTCSGWGLFALPRGAIVGVGKIRSLKPSVALAERLRDLQEKVTSLLSSLEIGANDVLVCEAPTTMRDPHAALKVEQVRCMFEDIARDRGAKVPGRINPRSVHFEVIGLKGKQLPRAQVKSLAVSCARVRFGSELDSIGFPTEEKELQKHQDIVDALLVGALAVARVDAATRAGCTVTAYFEQIRKPSRRVRCAW